MIVVRMMQLTELIGADFLSRSRNLPPSPDGSPIRDQMLALLSSPLAVQP